MTRDIAWGIIGPGRIAQRFADALTAVDHTYLAAVGSRDSSRAQAFAARFGARDAYGSYEELAASDVDAVYVATPHRFHFENARLCLEHGKHVLCEKPITVSAHEARQLSELAESRGLFLMEAMWSVFLPLYRQIREWLDADVIGRPTLMSSTFGFRAARDPDSRLLSPHLAGGALLDIGVYNIAISRFVTGRDPTGLDARGFLGETGVDEMTAVTLLFGDDTVSQFTATLLCQTANEFEIYGPEGSIRIARRFWESTRATLTVGDEETPVDLPPRHNGFEYQIEEAVSCIREGRSQSSVMAHSVSIGTMQTMDEIRTKIGLVYPFESPAS